MSQTLSIEEAAARLADLISHLQPGDEITVTAGNRPVATITPPRTHPAPRRQPGAGKGQIIEIKNDDEHLADFKEYMP